MQVPADTLRKAIGAPALLQGHALKALIEVWNPYRKYLLEQLDKIQAAASVVAILFFPQPSGFGSLTERGRACGRGTRGPDGRAGGSTVRSHFFIFWIVFGLFLDCFWIFGVFSTPNRTGGKEYFPRVFTWGIKKEKVDFPLVIDLGVFPTRSPNPTAQFDHRRNNSAIGFTCKTLVTKLTTASQALYRPCRNPSSSAWSRVCGTLAAGFRLVPCA